MQAEKRHLRIIMLMGLLILVPAAPLHAGPDEPTSAERLQLRVGALAEDSRVAGQSVADPWFLTRFYERRRFQVAWDSPTKLDALLVAIRQSTRHGLDPEDYHVAMLAELVAASREASLPLASAATELDMLATDALARLAFHLRFGKVNPENIDSNWNFSRDLDGLSPVTAIQALVNAENLVGALESYAPHGAHYRGLMEYLEAYRQIAGRGGWPRVDAGATLRAGMRSARVSALRERLAMTGDLPAGSSPEDPERFDGVLDGGVRRFQVRHGLEVDGAVGRRTLAALNVPVEARIDQLRINMERVRWVFRDLEPRFLLVNIARFQVLLMEDDVVTWSTRAVVGRPYRQTPIFKARMTYLEFNPPWTVPPTILREDLLPEIRHDPSVLHRRNLSVLDYQGRWVDPATIDWSSVSARTFPYRIRQEPGPDNPLGRVKFMYPNPYQVYMHDTPERALFARPERPFSSGCIRIEQPFELVRILLAGTEWDDEAIARVLWSGRTQVVNLPRPIAVLTLYGTAVPEGGQIHFAADVYGRDARLLAALNAPFVFSPPVGYEEALRGDIREADEPP
ncbi:MAG: murein L,D-transpeptidase [Gammaproteobacteria bacterium]